MRVSVFDRSVKEALYREQLVVDNAKRNLPLQGGSVVDFDDDGEVMSLLKEETALESDLAYQEALIAEREGEIQRIQSSVVEVNTIFKDLAVIITHQGEHLESIDANMYASSEKTKEVRYFNFGFCDQSGYLMVLTFFLFSSLNMSMYTTQNFITVNPNNYSRVWTSSVRLLSFK